TLWEERTGTSVHDAPAVADGVVVFATGDGVVRARDAATGAPLWTVNLAAGQDAMVGWLYAAPTISDGFVYIGTQDDLAAIDLMTGEIQWSLEPAPQNQGTSPYSAVAVAGGMGVGAFGRGHDGLLGFDATDGQQRWRIMPPLSTMVNVSP